MEGFVRTLSLPSQVNVHVQVWYLCFLVCVNVFKSPTNCGPFSYTESSRHMSKTENKGFEVQALSGASCVRQFKAEKTTCRLLSEVLVYERGSFVVLMCRNLTLTAGSLQPCSCDQHFLSSSVASGSARWATVSAADQCQGQTREFFSFSCWQQSGRSDTEKWANF